MLPGSEDGEMGDDGCVLAGAWVVLPGGLSSLSVSGWSGWCKSLVRSQTEPEILVCVPFEGTWEQIRDVGVKALADFIRESGRDKVWLAMGPTYGEAVSAEDLPTDDLLWAWKRDLEEHGKILVTLYYDPNPDKVSFRGSTDNYEQFCFGVRTGPDGPKFEVWRFSTDLLEEAKRIALSCG